jgi:hypothetical protein
MCGAGVGKSVFTLLVPSFIFLVLSILCLLYNNGLFKGAKCLEIDLGKVTIGGGPLIKKKNFYESEMVPVTESNARDGGTARKSGTSSDRYDQDHIDSND